MAYGTINADQIGTSVANTSLGAGNASIMKNRIINGAMVIDQRNAGASVTQNTTGTQYSLDRYVIYGTVAGKFTAQQNAGSVTPPVGFTNYLGITSTSAYSVGASDQYLVCQKIEGYNIADLQWGTANAKTVTLSFWVYSSLTGTFSGSLRNGASTFYSYPFTYTVSNANTWTQVSVTIAGSTSGTWAATTSSGIEVYWNLGAGSSNTAAAGAWTTGSYTGANSSVSIVGTNGATFYITGVQLEVGSSATGFEYRQYGQELALCQRYFQLFSNDGGANTGVFGSGYIDSSTRCFTYQNFLVTMRADPSATYSASSKFNVISASASSVSAIALWRVTTNGIFHNITTSSATAGQGCLLSDSNNTGAYVQLSAEL
jgi:hypothetical protein